MHINELTVRDEQHQEQIAELERSNRQKEADHKKEIEGLKAQLADSNNELVKALKSNSRSGGGRCIRGKSMELDEDDQVWKKLDSSVTVKMKPNIKWSDVAGHYEAKEILYDVSEVTTLHQVWFIRLAHTSSFSFISLLTRQYFYPETNHNYTMAIVVVRGRFCSMALLAQVRYLSMPLYI